VLCDAVIEMTAGLVDADLGGGLVKKRIRLPGRGKRGGARTIVATNRGDRRFFLLGFAKSERENIGEAEGRSLRQFAAWLLARTAPVIEGQIRTGELQEICHGKDETRQPNSGDRS